MSRLSYSVPASLSDLQRYIDDEVSESRHLEFKSARGFEGNWRSAVDKLSKEVSGFANSGGGVIVIGVSENSVDGKASVAASLDGIANEKHNAEWLENPLLECLSPKVPGIELSTIPLDSGNAIVVHVPQSFSGPHQAHDHRYYARRNFRLDPMEHYEIEDVRSRHQRRQVSFNPVIQPHGVYAISFLSQNDGDDAIYDIKYTFPKSISQKSSLENKKSRNFGNFSCKIDVLNPKISLFNTLGFYENIYEMEEFKEKVVIDISYKDRFGFNYSEEYFLYANNFGESFKIESHEEILSKVAKSLDKIDNNFGKFRQLLVSIADHKSSNKHD